MRSWVLSACLDQVFIPKHLLNAHTLEVCMNVFRADSLPLLLLAASGL